MKNTILIKCMQVLLSMVSPQLIKECIDSMLDNLETRILESKTQVDDLLVLPVIRQIRVALDIPDDDDIKTPGGVE